MTVHYYYDKISAYSASKVMNPLRLIAEYIREEHPGVKRVGVLAGTGAINSGMYHKALAACNVEIVTLDPEEQESIFMKSLFMENGFKSAYISEEAKDLMLLALKRLKGQGVDVAIGGCTEVSIGIDPAAAGVPFIDALDLLARKTVDYCYNLEAVEA